MRREVLFSVELKQAEQLENDDDNDNDSDDVEDVSVHARDSYQIARAMVNIYLNLSATHRKFA